jgi:hypothetical protein
LEEENKMANWKKSTVIGLVVCLLHLCMADAGLATKQAESVSPDLTKQQVSKGRKQPDAAKMKRVAERLGVGHHVMVKTAETKEYHGNIVALGAESFAILPDRTSQPVQIAYHDVQELGSSMTRRKGIIIAAVVLGGVLVLALTLGHLGRED